MPSIELSGIDVVGIIEINAYGLKAVVASKWSTNQVTGMPCRFSGSIYNRDLIIGATDGEEQFYFATTMDIGVEITLTDMECGQYTYCVEKIERSSSADYEKLSRGDWDLTVFVKNSKSVDEYVLLRCKAK